MSLIPGNVGTTPVQNIGAYGAEIKTAWFPVRHYRNQTIKTFTNEECHFGYRESILK
jgi:UDP-N-acetylmuramate dehydrogenase